MAIDPSLALDVKPVTGPNMNDILGMAKTAQDIQTSQAQQANLQAQNPGLAAMSQQQQFAAKKQQDLKDIIAQNSVINPDGTMDTSKVAPAMTRAGYGGDAFDFMKGQAGAQADVAKTAGDQLKARNDFISNLATSTMALPLEQQKAAWENGLKTFKAAHAPGTSSDLGIGTDPRFELGFTPGNVSGVATGMIDPKSAAEIRINQQNALTAATNAETSRQTLNYNMSMNWATPQGQDPTSPLAKTAREQYKAATGNDLPENTTLFDIHRLPGGDAVIQAAAAAQVTPVQAKVDAIKQQQVDKSSDLAYSSAENAISSKLSTEKAPETIVGAAAQKWYDNLIAQDPRNAVIQQGINQFNQSHGLQPGQPGYLNLTDGPLRVQQALQNDHAIVTNRMNSNQGLATSTNVGEAARATTNQPAAVSKVAPMSRVNDIVKNSNGKLTQEQVIQRLKANGYTIGQ